MNDKSPLLEDVYDVYMKYWRERGSQYLKPQVDVIQSLCIEILA